MAKVKVRRTHREELPGIAVLRDAVASETSSIRHRPRVLDLDMEVDPDLQHLIRHDPDGFFTAIEGDETVGFAAAHIRSRQCILSEMWVLSQHQGKGAGEALMRRLVAYGERSGVREFLAVVPPLPAVQGLLLRHSFAVVTPVYLFQLQLEPARALATALSSLLPGIDVTSELLDRRGHADIDRIDRFTRNITREIDHEYWLKQRGFGAAFVRQGSRVAAYAYGGADQVGPVAGSTQDAALSGLGWALQLALRGGDGSTLLVRVPAPFTSAIEALQEAGARLGESQMLYGRHLSLRFDRCLLGGATVP